MKSEKTRPDRRKARAWMVMNSLRIVDIQRALHHKQSTQVRETLSGHRNHRKVLAWLRDNGCPVECLHLPEDMKEKAQ